MPAAPALLHALNIRQYAFERVPRSHRRAFPVKSPTANGADFFVGKAEDAGILSYFKDDNAAAGEISPSAAHGVLIVSSIVLFQFLTAFMKFLNIS